MTRTKAAHPIRFLAGLLVIVLVLTGLLPWALSMQAGNTTTTIAISFEGAGNGLDPQGNRFDINEIKKDEIMTKAIKAAGMEGKVTAKELESRLYILPQAQRDTLKDLLTLSTISGKTENIREQMVYPTTFTIGLADTGLPSCFSDRKLLKEITKTYKAYLRSRYLGQTVSEPAYTKKEILALDYPEMMKVLAQNADSLGRYIAIFQSSEPQFVSKKNRAVICGSFSARRRAEEHGHQRHAEPGQILSAHKGSAEPDQL